MVGSRVFVESVRFVEATRKGGGIERTGGGGIPDGEVAGVSALECQRIVPIRCHVDHRVVIQETWGAAHDAATAAAVDDRILFWQAVVTKWAGVTISAKAVSIELASLGTEMGCLLVQKWALIALVALTQVEEAAGRISALRRCSGVGTAATARRGARSVGCGRRGRRCSGCRCRGT